MLQLHRWQLQQLGAILRHVDDSCWVEGAADLSNALEQRVLPWLEGLQTTLELWHSNLSYATQNNWQTPVNG
jgi:hypothetical protein